MEGGFIMGIDRDFDRLQSDSNEVDELAEELADSFRNGNISWVMQELERLDKFEAMLMVLRVSELFRLNSTRISFERAIKNRI